jgi:hypothetical protein
LIEFFKDNHLQIYEISTFKRNLPDSLALLQNADIIKKRLAGKNKGKYEGFWVNQYNTNIIGIERHENGYRATLLESKVKENYVGTIVAQMQPIFHCSPKRIMYSSKVNTRANKSNSIIRASTTSKD